MDNVRKSELTFHSFHALKILAIFDIGRRIENPLTEYWTELTGQEGDYNNSNIDFIFEIAEIKAFVACSCLSFHSHTCSICIPFCHAHYFLLKGDGTGVFSIYGEVAYPDENFKIKHDSPGLLSMVSVFQQVYMILQEFID